MERGKIRILAAEGNATYQLVLRTLLALAGMDGRIARPIEIAVRFATIEQALDEAEASRAAAKAVGRDTVWEPLGHDPIRRNRLVVESCSRLKSLSAFCPQNRAPLSRNAL